MHRAFITSTCPTNLQPPTQTIDQPRSMGYTVHDDWLEGECIRKVDLKTESFSGRAIHRIHYGKAAGYWAVDSGQEGPVSQ